ncbi:MAG TPA: MdtA/MuxA family multidrug efflux RND transporter periplasmic adaptor subunit [Tepidisphaeraceae bacterium]
MLALTLCLLSGCGDKQTAEGKKEERRPLPVVIADARRADFPVYLDALGSVAALNTVTLRSRADGEVMKVHYTEGQTVKKGDLLIEIDPRQYQTALQQAQGQLSRDQAMLQNAQADLARYTAARETVSQQQIDTAEAGVAEYQAALKVDQAAIAGAELQLSYCRITAPIDGKIGLRAIDVGNIVRAGDSTGLATITQLQPIGVIFNLPEVHLPSVLQASKSDRSVTADVFDATRTRKLASGGLEAIDNQIDPTTATVRIKAVFDNKDGMLFPNQFVNVRLLVRTLDNVVVTPTGAVQNSPDTRFVYVIQRDDTVEMRPVTVGPAEGEQTVIDSGLRDGERVVVEGLDKLAPGMAVKPHYPSTRPAVAAVKAGDAS